MQIMKQCTYTSGKNDSAELHRFITSFPFLPTAMHIILNVFQICI